MASAQEHYEHHLGPIYSWMLGGMAAALENARAELRALGFHKRKPGLAMDLGAGPGVYSIPLAELGFSVVALDTCSVLLEELKCQPGGESVQAIHGDLTSFRSHHPEKVDLILCMTDTLTHLPTREAVEMLLQDVRAALKSDGIFVATFRDHVSAPLEGAARFIPVHSDENRILTCFLEYGDETVTVHDIMHVRKGTGWTTEVSAYPKLRLDPAWVEGKMKHLGFDTVLESGNRGMVRIVGRVHER